MRPDRETSVEAVPPVLGGRVTRRELLRRAGLGAGVLAVAPMLGGLVTGTQTVEAATRRSASGGTLKFGLSSYPPSFNPFLNTGNAAYLVLGSVFRGLVGYDAKGNFRPEIAQSWQTQDGGKAVVFTLRKNAVFHNGDPVTAADVKFSMEYILDATNAASLNPNLQVVSSVDVVDDQTVRFNLPTPDTALLAILAEPDAPIVSQKELTADATNFVGAGPFTIQSQEQGTKVVLQRFPKFYRGTPKLASIDFVAYPDSNLRVEALESGSVNMIDYVQWQSIGSLQGSSKTTTAGTGTGAFMYLEFNLTKAPFNNPKVRTALGYAINRKNIIDTAFFGSGSIADGIPIPSWSPYFDKAQDKVWTHDPKKAKQLLHAAGYAKGFSATLLATSQYSFHQATAESVQADLKKIGLDITLQLPDWATRVSLGNSGNYDFAVQGSGGEYNDPDYLTGFLTGGTQDGRSAGPTDPQFATLLSQGRETSKESARKAAYGQVATLFAQQTPILPLTWRSQYYGLDKTIKNFKPLPGFLIFYAAYGLEDLTIGGS